MSDEKEKDGRIAKGELTPRQIQKIADKVYQLWRKEMRIERERYRPANRR